MNYTIDLKSYDYAIMIAQNKRKPMYQIVKDIILENGGKIIHDDDSNEWVIKPLMKTTSDISILEKILNIVKGWKEVVFFKKGEICSIIPSNLNQVIHCIEDKGSMDVSSYCRTIHSQNVNEFALDNMKELKIEMDLPCKLYYDFWLHGDENINKNMVFNNYKRYTIEYGCELCPFFNIETFNIEITEAKRY